MFIKTDILQNIHARARDYDLKNTYPTEDLDILKKVGYLKAFVPKHLNGHGLSLHEIIDEQINLSMHAPSTALCLNMHQIIVGLGHTLVDANNEKGQLILELAANQKLLSFGISEASNDLVLFGSLTKALQTNGGDYLISGKKIFITNANEFDYLLIHAHDQVLNKTVFGLIERNAKGIEVLDDWDALGMRASRSCTIKLNEVILKKEHILSIINPGPSNEPIIKGIFTHFELLLAATYHGIGIRALEVGIEHVKLRKSLSSNKTYANDKDIRWRISESAILLDGIKRDLDGLASNFLNKIDDPHAFLKLSTIKNKAVETSKKVVDEMMRASGGSSYHNSHELSRLYRDVLAGIFQPSDQESLHNAWSNALLGPIE